MNSLLFVGDRVAPDGYVFAQIATTPVLLELMEQGLLLEIPKELEKQVSLSGYDYVYDDHGRRYMNPVNGKVHLVQIAKAAPMKRERRTTQAVDDADDDATEADATDEDDLDEDEVDEDERIAKETPAKGQRSRSRQPRASQPRVRRSTRRSTRSTQDENDYSEAAEDDVDKTKKNKMTKKQKQALLRQRAHTAEGLN